MNIEARTITTVEYAVTLTDADVAAILVDPAAFQQRLRAMRGEQATGRHGARNLTIGRKPGKAKKEKPAASPKGAAGKGKFAKAPCPECGQMIAGSQMRQHRARKHGVGAVRSSENN